MSLTKAKGNMYGWCTHTHTHLSGQCPHQCSYCLVQAMARRFPAMAARYSGPVALEEKELKVNYGTGRTIFIEHLNDLFADAIPAEWIARILEHCRQWPENTYVFQTKNPARYLHFLEQIRPGSILGTTIESNRIYWIHRAPDAEQRWRAMLKLPHYFQRFVTIEPVLDFSLDVMLLWMSKLRPDFINIGADSKGSDLPEPSKQKVQNLIAGLKNLGLSVNLKTNLQRLLK